MWNISWIFIGLLIIFPYHDALKSQKKKFYFKKYRENDKICNTERNLCGPDADCARLGNSYQCLCRKDGMPEGPGKSCQRENVDSVCLGNEFRCADGEQCIPVIWRCDGVRFDNEHSPGCRDGSDEVDCDKHLCSKGEHRCGNGWCIPALWVCDKEKHCDDESDEMNCTSFSDTNCLINQFQCANGECVPKSLRCNGLIGDGCTDFSDESGCPEVWCPEGHFRCLFNESMYVHKMRCFQDDFMCDGASNCIDNSDENYCNPALVRCDDETQFACLRRTQCIEKEKRCDRVRDCKDGTDEKDCYKCNPPCENGGTCLHDLTCACTEDFRGAACEYHRALCSVVKNKLKNEIWKNITWETRISSSTDTEYFISCGFPQTNTEPLIPNRWYSCSIDGHWKPPLPPCVQNFCFENEHRCGDGNCLNQSGICDREQNCIDDSDEKYCFYKETEFIFFNEGPKVYKKNVTIGSVQNATLLEIPLSKAIITGLSFDVKHEILFISHARIPAICEVNLSSLQKRELVTESIDFPVDIAYDWTSNNLYWIDSGSGTAEVVSVDTLSRSIIISGLSRPVSLALLPESGVMFIAAATEFSYGIFRYEMDGRNRRILYTVEEFPASLALHPSKTLLYWTNTREGTISFGNYNSSSPYSVLRKGMGGIMSLSVSKDDIFFTAEDEKISGKLHRLKVGGYQKDGKWKSIASPFTFPPAHFPGNYKCLVDKGGCDYLCLTNELGRSCACSSEKILDADGTSCIDKN